MCCCAQPNVNGQPGYSWNGKSVGTYPLAPPTLKEGDTLLFDEPGRCGGMDSHSHSYRLVRNGDTQLLVRHGGGEERIRVAVASVISMDLMDSNTRYWLLNALYHAYSDGRRDGASTTAAEYRQAFAEGRLKKRKQRLGATSAVKIWIEGGQSVG